MNSSAVPCLISDKVLSYLSGGNDLINSCVLGEVWKESALRHLSQRGSCCILVQYRQEQSFRLIFSHLSAPEKREFKLAASLEEANTTDLFEHWPYVSPKEVSHFLDQSRS